MGEAFDGGAGLWLMDWVVNRREFLSIGLFHLEQARHVNPARANMIQRD
jgi:hypothetical protein